MNTINNGAIIVPEFDFVESRHMAKWNPGVRSMIA
jgi:hypothetical protein